MIGEWIKASAAHLDSVGEDYFEHRRFAFRVGSLMVIAGLACILHSLVPALFPDKASRTINRLHDVIHRDRRLIEDQRRELPPLLFFAPLCLCVAILPWLGGADGVVASALTILSLALLAAFGWSEDDQGDPIELLIPVRLD